MLPSCASPSTLLENAWNVRSSSTTFPCSGPGAVWHSRTMSSVTTSTPMAEVLNLQRSAFFREGPPDLRTRRNRIDRFAAAVVGHRDDLAAAITSDYGSRSEAVTWLADIGATVAEAEVVRHKLRQWMKPRHPQGRLMAGAMRVARLRARVEPTPLGVVGVMGMWNFPLNLGAVPAIDALAAGNRVMLKMSERLPATSEVLANALHDVFDVEELAVVTGGLEVSREFASLPFDHIFFTGSSATGSKIMEAAAKNLTPVTLELGGKNPVVISPRVGHDRSALMRAATRVATSRVINGGQVCLSPDVVYVPAPAYGTFVHEISAAWLQLLPDLLQRGDFTSLIDEAAYQRGMSLLEDAAEKGAQILPAFALEGEDGDQLRAQRIFPPVVVLDVEDEMVITEEEHFAPIIIIKPYEKLNAVLADLAARPSPLVATWYGPSDDDFREFVRRSRSGGVVRNDWGLSNMFPGLPFGGVGQSGVGQYHGRFGFDTFSHQRTVAESDSRRFAAAETFTPPVTTAVREALGSYGRLIARRLDRY